MSKTIKDFAEYLKTIIVPEADEAYRLKPAFQMVLEEEEMREGVRAFRAFLYRLCDMLIAKGEAYDHPKKVAHAYENRITLSVNYPFLHNVKTLLMNIGFHGVDAENNQFLISSGNLLNVKLPVSKSLECLRFLVDCGIQMDGIDLSDKKQNLSDIKAIKISYPDDPLMLTGFKVMAMAEAELGTLANQDVFMRCDDRVLRNDQADVVSILKDTIITLPTDVQHFILAMHERYLDKGCKCIVEIKGFWIYMKYSYKRKDIFGINASLNNGFHINVKTQHMHQYADVIETFPPCFKELIAKGYGCGRKREGIGLCDGGCRGMPISLDASVLELRDDIITWFDKELTYIG